MRGLNPLEFRATAREDAGVGSIAADSQRPDERDLLLRHRSGDGEAFAELVAEYRAPVYGYLVRCGVPENDRDDLFQEIFVSVHAAAARYDADRPLHPWLFTIVANRVRTYQRKRRLRDLVFSDAPPRDPVAPVADAERAASVRQTTDWLEHEIRKLSPIRREVLVLACVENLPQKEIAEALGLPVNTVKTHLRRARLALVKKLARRNAAPGDEVSS